ncbi:MAG: 7-cyano-7-deazaguanine synthase [Candidatus Hermodarchaeota archaeon]
MPLYTINMPINGTKVLCLISGGIDSPVAAQIAIKNGFHPILLHYHNFPFHSLGTLEKVVALCNSLADQKPNISISLAIMVHGKSQEVILNKLEGRNLRLTCLLCRMLMFFKAEVYAQEIGAEMIVTGEILGEQASQTLDNLPIVISRIRIPVLRPLIGYNKEEVIHLSRKWGFYDLSILPGGCCSINPKYPETKGQLEFVSEIFNQIEEDLKVNAQNELDQILTFNPPIEIKDVLENVEI